MPKKIEFNNKTVFQCAICGLKYRDLKTAIACEQFCKAHPNTCDPKIAEKAIK